jgi:hypothetical protein
MSRREPGRKVHRFTSWWALFILNSEKFLGSVLEGGQGLVRNQRLGCGFASCYRMPPEYGVTPCRYPERPQCLGHRSLRPHCQPPRLHHLQVQICCRPSYGPSPLELDLRSPRFWAAEEQLLWPDNKYRAPDRSPARNISFK